MKWLGIIGIALSLLFIPSAQVAEAYGFQAAHNVTIPAGSSVDGTYYAAGQVLDVSGTVNGDLICAGDTVTISGPVHGDVICAGQDISITGPVDGSVRIAGQSVTLDSTVGRNATIAAQTLEIGHSASIAGDLGILAQSTSLNGAVAKTVYGNAQSMSVDSSVGPMSVMVASLSLGANAHVNGDLHYTSQHAIAIDHAKISGAVTYTATPAKQYHAHWFPSLFGLWLWWLVGALIVGLALVLLVPGTMRRVSVTMRERPGPAIGWGLLVELLTPIVALLLLFTVIGIPLALLALAVWIILLALSPVLAGIAVGQWVIERYNWGHNSFVWGSLLGIVILMILFAIPFLGALLSLVASWWAIGGSSLNFRLLRH